MNLQLVIFLSVTLILFVINLIFQVSAHIQKGVLYTNVFDERYVIETFETLEHDFLFPYWCFILQIIISALNFFWIVICATTNLMQKTKSFLFYPILFFNFSMICETVWIVYFTRVMFLEMTLGSSFQLLMQLVGCILMVAVMRRMAYIPVHFYLFFIYISIYLFYILLKFVYFY